MIKGSGTACVVRSYARIFYRNAINIGLPILVFEQVDEIQKGDELAIDPILGKIVNITAGRAYTCAPLPANVMELVKDRGLIPHLKKHG